MSTQKEPYFLFRKIIGFFPGDIELYQTAFRHKSSSIRRKDGMLINNERLEFLGDAVLGVLVADMLFQHFDTEGEGFLTSNRSKIVQRSTLNKIALEIGLDKLIIASVQSHSPRQSIYGNTLEALIGTIYLDKGYRACKKFLEKNIVKRFLNIEQLAEEDYNFKSKLLEWGQRHKAAILFKTEETERIHDRNMPEFEAQVLLCEQSIGRGVGFSKKEAQQKAAEEALLKIKHDRSYIHELLYMSQSSETQHKIEEQDSSDNA